MSNTNEFDPEPLNEPDIDQDGGFEEFEGAQGKSIGSSWKSSPLVKFGLVGAAIIVVIAMVSLFGGDSPPTPTSVVSKTGGSGLKDAPGTSELTPVMKEALEERNQQVVEEAQKTGTSAIATPIEPPKAVLSATDDTTKSEDPLLRWQQMQEERAKSQQEQAVAEQKPQTDPQREARLNTMVSGMSNQFGEILNNKTKEKKLQHIEVVSMADLLKGSAEGVQVAGDTAVDGGTASAVVMENKKPATIILPAGKIEYAQMMLEANSDIPGPVVAMIASGTFNGGKLLGKFTRKDDYLVVTFTTLVTRKGTSIPINAYAVDPKSSLTGVATDVDHRYFRRIVLPAAAKFIEGLGDAYAQTTTTTSQSSSSTVTSSEKMNTKQQFGKGVSEAASSMSDILDEDAKQTEPLVIVAAGTAIGVLFMEPVTDETILRARAGVSTVSAGQQTGIQQSPTGNPYQQQGTGYMNPFQQLQYGLQGQQFLQQGGYMPATNGQGTTSSEAGQ